jgi:hypothetical protein
MHENWLDRAKCLAALGAWLGLSACDTSAVGVESCRQIEYARCGAATHCPDMFKITSVDACKRFYRDHCLHGLALDRDPGASNVTPCANAITEIGNCAATGPSGPATLVQDCEPTIDNVGGNNQVCSYIQKPETIAACLFLNPAASTADDSGTN